MTFVLVTFVTAVLVVLAVYFLLFERGEAREEHVLRRRLRRGLGSGGDRARAEFVRAAEKASSVDALNKLLQRSQKLSGLQLVLAQAGLTLTPGAVLLMSVVAGVAAWVVVWRVAGLWWLGALAGAVAVFVPFLVVRYKAQKRIQLFEEQFPQALDLIGRALRAGHAFTTGLAMVAEEAPEPVGGEFRIVYDQQNFGLPLPDALKAFAERVRLLDARFFVTAVLTQRESGGNLAEVLDNLASVIRERFKVKRQVRVVTAHARITGWVLAGLPPALAVAMLFVSPGSMKLMITDPLGPPMLIGAAVAQVLGSLLIRRLVNIEY